MKRITHVLALLALAVCLPTLNGNGKEPQKLAELMQKKLKGSQKVLEGLALNDFEKITTGADEIVEVAKKAEWMVVKTPQYEMHSNAFRRNAEDLIKNAKAKNLDGATLAYVDMTMNCVKCHKHVREVRMARLDGKGPAVGIPGE